MFALSIEESSEGKSEAGANYSVVNTVPVPVPH